MDNSGITILNVDGSEVGLYTKSRILHEAGYRVIEARTGEEARRLTAGESPHLVLLSADLPDCSGFEALGMIKTAAALASQAIPPLVLLVSATFVGCEKRARALEEGADGYLLEPATPEFLRANVKMLLRLRPGAGDVARHLADKLRRMRALEIGARLALAINSAESIEEVLQIAATEARELIGAHQAIASLNTDALDSNDSDTGRPEAAIAVSLSEKYAQEPVAASDRLCETWFSQLVCRLRQPMRLTQAEMESQFDCFNETNKTYESHKPDCHPQELEEVITPRELETLRRMACLREINGLHEVATPREIAGLREIAGMRSPQILRGLDMRGWMAAPLASCAGVCGRNLGLIQLSDKYDGEFTEGDEIALARLAQMVSKAVENRLRWRREQKLRKAAENAAFAKDEFMAMTSYKLRAQLNTLLGWSWVLRRQAGNMEDVARAAEIIERAARTQARLVEDLLGASRKNPGAWRDGETEALGDWETGRRGDGETGGLGDWETRRNGDFISPAPGLPVSPSPYLPVLRPSIYYTPNSSTGRMAAGGGC